MVEEDLRTIKWKIESKLRFQVNDQVCPQIRFQVVDQVGNQVLLPLWVLTGSQVLTQVRNLMEQE